MCIVNRLGFFTVSNGISITTLFLCHKLIVICINLISKALRGCDMSQVSEQGVNIVVYTLFSQL